MIIKYSSAETTTGIISKKSSVMNMNYDEQDIPNPFYIHALTHYSYFGNIIITEY